MKKLLIGLVLLSSVSTFADSCRISDKYIGSNGETYSTSLVSSDNLLNCIKRARETLQAKPDLNQVEIEHSGLSQAGLKMNLEQLNADTRISAPIKF